MTCIVGLVDGLTVYMGADSVGSDGTVAVPYKTRKIIRSENMLIGFSDSYRAGNLLAHRSRIVPNPEAGVDSESVVLAVVDGIRNIWREGGYLKVDNNRETGATMLIAYDGRLFHVAADELGLVEAGRGYDAIGSGYVAALGSLHTSAVLDGIQYSEMTPDERVMQALYAASELTIGVGPPFYVETLRAE